MCTTDNPSDLPTRGMRAEDLAKCELWWKGPSFLRRPRHEWPDQPHVRAMDASAAETRTVEEIAKSIVLMNVQTSDNKLEERQVALIEKFCDKGHGLRKAVRMLARLAEGFFNVFRNAKFRHVL